MPDWQGTIQVSPIHQVGGYEFMPWHPGHRVQHARIQARALEIHAGVDDILLNQAYHSVALCLE